MRGVKLQRGRRQTMTRSMGGRNGQSVLLQINQRVKTITQSFDSAIGNSQKALHNLPINQTNFDIEECLVVSAQK